jgi:hypothetical protein
MISRILSNRMNDRKRELALSQILAKALVLRILLRLQIHVVVLNLEEQTQRIHQRNVIRLVCTKSLHQSHRQTKQTWFVKQISFFVNNKCSTSSLVQDHCPILLFQRAMQHVAPQNIKALAFV